VDDGSAYQIGHALIEHGNRYDAVNNNHWAGLRAIRSAQSRFEPAWPTMRVSAGSWFVEQVINELKKDFPFVDLLQPSGPLVALFLLYLRPQLIFDWSTIGRAFYISYIDQSETDGLPPRDGGYIRSEKHEILDPELTRLFGDEYRELLRDPGGTVASGTGLVRKFKESIKLDAFLQSLDEIKAKKMHHALLHLLYGSGSVLAHEALDWLEGREPISADTTDRYFKAAQRLLRHPDISVVIMGHTHQPRNVKIGQRNKCVLRYLNSGTWIDSIDVCAHIGSEATLSDMRCFLGTLLTKGGARLRSPMSTYVDLSLGSDGRVESARLLKA
jgi:hypothetical protein